MSMPTSTSTSTPSPSNNEPDHVNGNGKHSQQCANERETTSSDESAGYAYPTVNECLLTETDADDVRIDTAFHSSEPESQKPFRRSSSLRVPKEYGGAASATQKKIVRFADVLGLDLANVRTFLQELPSVPKRAYEDLTDKLDAEEAEMGAEAREPCGESSCKSLQPTFTMPVELADFFDRVRDQCVCLETVRVLESPVHHITGRIRVKNLDFCKSVYIRYTLDEWKTYARVRAAYVDEPDADRDRDREQESHDKFGFVIYLYDTVAVGQRVQFAIEYHCRDCVYWDNNDGKNYVLECYPTSPRMPSYFHCVPSSPTVASCTGENFNSFY